MRYGQTDSAVLSATGVVTRYHCKYVLRECDEARIEKATLCWVALILTGKRSEPKGQLETLGSG